MSRQNILIIEDEGVEGSLNLSEIDSLGPVCLKKWDSLLYLDAYVWREDEELIKRKAL